MFLCSGDRDHRVAFKVHQGSQASLRLEAKNSTLLSSCDGFLLELIEWPKGVMPPVEFGERTQDWSLGPAGKEGPHLAMKGEPPGFSRIVTGFSSYDGELREDPVLAQGSPISIRVAKGS